MYVAVVFVTMLAAPLLSIALEYGSGSGPLVALVGKWFVFWTVGVRLGLAGARQIVQPGFTAKDIFNIADEKALAIVRELGFANLALAIVGLVSLVEPTFVLPAAITAGIGRPAPSRARSHDERNNSAGERSVRRRHASRLCARRAGDEPVGLKRTSTPSSGWRPRAGVGQRRTSAEAG